MICMTLLNEFGEKILSTEFDAKGFKYINGIGETGVKRFDISDVLRIVIKAGSKVVGGLTSKFTGVRKNSSAVQYEGEI